MMFPRWNLPLWLYLFHVVFLDLVTQCFSSPMQNIVCSGGAWTLNRPVVQTSHGQLKGFQRPTEDGTMIDVFLGIPFAKPPAGLLRFKRPQSPVPWTGVKDATAVPKQCPQPSPEKKFPEGEDCLYLNVYRPSNTSSTSSTPLPVMVWIHGGGFVFGTGAAFDGSTLASENVIVVTINYRLGVLGYMSMEDDGMPGNYGMMDQIMALRWVRGNIRGFGGDPDSVTVFGQSAGSASISLLMLSPLSMGLFKRAIMESGGSLSPFSIASPWDPVSPKTMATAISARCGCRQQDTDELLKCLQNLNPYTILNATGDVFKTFGPTTMFKPRVENAFGFLPDYPWRLLSTGQFLYADTLRGFNTNELAALPQDPENDGITDAEFHTGVHNTLRDNFAFLDQTLVSQTIDDMYISNTTDPFTIRSRSGDFLSDLYFTAPAVKELLMTRKHDLVSKTYLYQFDYLASFVETPKWMGVTHSAELPFIFGLPHNSNITDTDRLVHNSMVNMWTNFAKYGSPTPFPVFGSSRWTQFTSTTHSLFKISENSGLKDFSNIGLMNMFDVILSESDKALYRDPSVVG